MEDFREKCDLYWYYYKQYVNGELKWNQANNLMLINSYSDPDFVENYTEISYDGISCVEKDSSCKKRKISNLNLVNEELEKNKRPKYKHEI